MRGPAAGVGRGGVIGVWGWVGEPEFAVVEVVVVGVFPELVIGVVGGFGEIVEGSDARYFRCGVRRKMAGWGRGQSQGEGSE